MVIPPAPSPKKDPWLLEWPALPPEPSLFLSQTAGFHPKPTGPSRPALTSNSGKAQVGRCSGSQPRSAAPPPGTGQHSRDATSQEVAFPCPPHGVRTHQVHRGVHPGTSQIPLLHQEPKPGAHTDMGECVLGAGLREGLSGGATPRPRPAGRAGAVCQGRLWLLQSQTCNSSSFPTKNTPRVWFFVLLILTRGTRGYFSIDI